ncbi:hypothetical protein [Limimaricola cinnabarinus]|uniref:Uncharacterized protein n=1 Tax=Limimaricola cinnabarinus LL-001 TaxID=1337093 RepID=U2YZY7_9RHOB|nr:hypothetical protein [Limimaricola cinnabarinus]GAD54655.1 hypothetical protein MBELCI_0707 [Limimaricola cinnabarinus LL-001]
MDEERVEVIDKVRLWPSHATVAGRVCRVKWGAWAVYLPGPQVKIMHAVSGLQHCIYHKAPRREEVLGGFDRRGDAENWARAFSTPVLRRVAENWVMFARLHAAGIGPEPMGLVAVRDYRSFFSRGRGITAGLRLADLTKYPEKTPTTEAELRGAGILPDRSRASLREQIRGYVSDLNNLHGAMPEDGEAEVAQVEAALARALGR